MCIRDSFWLFVLSAVAYLDRTNISIAGVQIGSDFHVDKIHLGWVFSAFLCLLYTSRCV